MTDPTPTRDEAVLLPCPFCGGKNIDPEGWASIDRKGPACDDCSGCADTVELWNSRPLASAPAPASGEPVSKAVERILDEHSAWIAAPSPEVVGRIAFAATLAADLLAKQEKAAEDSVRDALWAGKPFVFDPATGFAHADDGGAPAGGVRWEPTAECDPCMWDQDKPCTCGGATCEQVDFGQGLASLSPAATPVSEAEPVAWRRRGKHIWFYRESAPTTQSDPGWRPLYDEPASLSTAACELRAQITPFSSVVGQSVLLTDETGAALAQLSISIPDPNKPYRETAEEIAGVIELAINRPPSEEVKRLRTRLGDLMVEEAKRMAALAKPASEPAGGGVDFWTPKRIAHVLADCAVYFRTLYERHKIGPAQRGIDPDKLDAASRVAAALSSSAGPATEQWQWAGCGHSAWFDGQPPFGTRPDEVEKRTLYAHPAPATVESAEVSAIMEMFGRWQSGYAFDDDRDDDVDLESRVEAELAALAPATEGRKS